VTAGTGTPAASVPLVNAAANAAAGMSAIAIRFRVR